MSPSHTRICTWLSCLCLLFLQGGCGSDSGASNGVMVGDRPPAELGDAISLMEGGSRPPALQDNGLEIRKWLISDNTLWVATSLVTYGEPAPMDDQTARTLHQNGVRIWRAPYDEIESIRAGFGGTSIDQQWWFGQVTDWTELHGRSLGGRRRGIAVDGGVRSFEDGSFSLLMRAWSAKTTDGPCLQMELLPFYADASAGSFRRAMQQTREAGEVFATMLANVTLEEGYAYFLTCEQPAIDWAGVAETGEFRDDVVVPEGGGVRRTGPTTFGPDSGGPWTIGEALLRGAAEVGNRGVVVMIPHLPDRLYPVEMLPEEVDGSGSAEVTEGQP